MTNSHAFASALRLGSYTRRFSYASSILYTAQTLTCSLLLWYMHICSEIRIMPRLQKPSPREALLRKVDDAGTLDRSHRISYVVRKTSGSAYADAHGPGLLGDLVGDQQ